MPEIHVTDLRGGEAIIQAPVGATLMEALRDNGFDDVLALCGGCCSCATCHVYVEAGPASLTSGISADEDDLLESSDHRKTNSRLSCQVKLADADEPIRIRIAPAD